MFILFIWLGTNRRKSISRGQVTCNYSHTFIFLHSTKEFKSESQFDEQFLTYSKTKKYPDFIFPFLKKKKKKSKQRGMDGSVVQSTGSSCGGHGRHGFRFQHTHF